MTAFSKYKPYIFNFLKVLIVGFTVYYIYYQVWLTDNFNQFWEQTTQLQTRQIWFLVIATLLLTLNWGLETFKWQILISKIEKISYLRAFKAVLSGVTISTLMPNRLADYLGRVLYLSPTKRLKAIFATLVGSFAQILITVLSGSAAFLFYIQGFDDSEYFFYVILFFVLGLNILLVLLFYNIGLLNRLLPNRGFYKKIRQYVKVFDYYHSSGLTNILLVSLLRYGVFISQYVLLIWTFSVEIAFWQAISAIALVFLVQSIVPSIALADLGIRGATAIHFIGQYSQNYTGIITGAYSLWIINLVLPAIVGAFFILLIKVNANNAKS